jgi:hypothetical protein
MKNLLMIVCVFFLSLEAVGADKTSSGRPNSTNSSESRNSFQSRPNIFGGQRYYSSGRPVGYSRPNIYGGQNYNSYGTKKK